jgi:hypothetical protein
VGFALALNCCERALTAELEVSVQANRASREVIIKGLDPDQIVRVAQQGGHDSHWPSVCKVVALTERHLSPSEATPLLGSYHASGRVLRFVSRYPLDQPSYQVLVDVSLLDPADKRRLRDHNHRGLIAINLDFASTPSPPRAAARVVAVHPSAEVLPENLLRFYIHFSAPMSRGEAYQHLHLLDESGKPVPDAFLELDEELWSPDGRRFTLLIDPGRIKHGLRPREELGPVLEQGKSYTLVIDREWPDAGGHTLEAGFRKPFQVRPPDQRPPSPGQWKLVPPEQATMVPVEVSFPEPLDSALALRLIVVKDSQGKAVSGQSALDRNETRWRYTPAAPWPAGEYRLEIGTALEDLAGNGIGRPFEVDAVEPITTRLRSEAVALPFRIGPPGD